MWAWYTSVIWPRSFADFLGFLQPPEELSLARGSPDQLIEAGPYAQTLRNPREA
jgi:hypothetical protein